MGRRKLDKIVNHYKANPGDRLRVLDGILTKLGREEALEALRRVLPLTKDPTVLDRALKVCGQAGGAGAISLIQPFLTHDNRKVMARAVKAIMLCDPETGSIIITPLLNQDDEEVRAIAAFGLNKFYPELAFETVKQLGLSSKKRYRHSALECMGWVDHADRELLLLDMFEREADLDLVEALSKLISERTSARGVERLHELRASLLQYFRRRAPDAPDTLDVAYIREKGLATVGDDAVVLRKLETLEKARMRISGRIKLTREQMVDLEEDAAAEQRRLDEARAEEAQSAQAVEEDRQRIEKEAKVRTETRTRRLGFAGKVGLVLGLALGLLALKLHLDGRKARRAPVRVLRTKVKIRSVLGDVGAEVDLRGKVFRVQADRETVIFLKEPDLVISARFPPEVCLRFEKGDEVRLKGTIREVQAPKVIYLDGELIRKLL